MAPLPVNFNTSVATPGSAIMAQWDSGDGDGYGADDAQVVIVDIGRRAVKDDDGWYSFGELQPGSYLVEATSPRYGRAVERIEVPAGRTVRAIGRIAMEIAAIGPADAILYFIDQIVRTFKMACPAECGVNHAAGYIVFCRFARPACNLDITKPMIDKTRLPCLLSGVVKDVGVGLEKTVSGQT